MRDLVRTVMADPEIPAPGPAGEGLPDGTAPAPSGEGKGPLPALSSREAELLAILAGAAEPQTVSGLAEQLGVGLSRISRMLDRLCEAGLVRRDTNPTNRRSVLVRIDEQGPEAAPVDQPARALSPREAELLTILAQAARPQSVGSLAEQLGVGLSRISRMLDRLCEAGLVRRDTNPANRRSVLVRIADQGPEAAAIGQPVRTLSRREAELLAVLTESPDPQTVQALAERLGVSKSRISWMLDRLCAAGLASRRTDPTNRRNMLVRATGGPAPSEGHEGMRATRRDGPVPARLPAGTRGRRMRDLVRDMMAEPEVRPGAEALPSHIPLPRALSPREAALLAVLTGSTEPQTVGSLAERLGVGMSQMSLMLDRLCEAGLARRDTNPANRRSVLVRAAEVVPEDAAPAHALPVAMTERNGPRAYGAGRLQPSPRQMEVLLDLAAAPTPPNERHLAAGLGVSTAAVCTMVRRLQRNGLVTKAQDPADARSMRIMLTPAGLQQVCGFIREFRKAQAERYCAAP